MKNLEMAVAALAFLVAAGGMAFYEWSRIQAGRPILKGREVVVLYWVTYLSLFVLGVTAAIAAIVR